MDYFGEDTCDVIRDHPERLKELSALSVNIIKKIVSGCKKEKILADVNLTIDAYQFPVNTANRIYEQYGENAQAVLDQSPYAIVGVEGVGFKTADKFAQNSPNYRPDWIQRIEAFELSLLKDEALSGHSCLPVADMISRTVVECGVEKTLAEQALQNHFQNRTIIYDRMETSAGAIEMAYQPGLYYAEVKATTHFNRIRWEPPAKPVPREGVEHILTELEELAEKQLTDEQKLAVVRVFTNKISIITGPPGTGKTTCLRAAVAVADRIGIKYDLCAPTGRAAKNMAGATGKKAKTIHRLLEYKPKAERKTREDTFKKNGENQLGLDLLFVDETSMVDIQMLRSLLQAIPNGCRLVFLGDDNQLPSVRPGRCLHDLIRSQACTVTALTIIHRQAQESLIITNAHRILEGHHMYLPIRDPYRLNQSDCVFLDVPMIENPNDDSKKIEDPNFVQQMVQWLCAAGLPQYCGMDPVKDIQVLTPRKDGRCGVHELNKILQNTINPHGKVLDRDRFGREFREGDRVMVIKNNYDLNIFNGDIGTVTGYDLTAEALSFDFYGEKVLLKVPDAREIIVLSYAATIHRSQGSEYRATVLVVLKQHGIMLARNLLYTGITRAKQRLGHRGFEAGARNRNPKRKADQPQHALVATAGEVQLQCSICQLIRGK